MIDVMTPPLSGASQRRRRPGSGSGAGYGDSGRGRGWGGGAHEASGRAPSIAPPSASRLAPEGNSATIRPS